MTDENRAIVRVSNTQLEQWGERELISEMLERVMSLHPAANKVGRSGMAAACQLAILSGASPLPGQNELHVWRDNKDRLVIQLGIEYHRRRAKEVAGGVDYVPGQQPRPMTEDERHDYEIEPNQIAFISRGFRRDDFDKYVPYLGNGMTIGDIWGVIARIGVGVVGKGEYAKKGRPTSWTAEKRCETDLLKKLIPSLERPDDDGRLEKARDAIMQMQGRVSMMETEDVNVDEVNAALFGDDPVDTTWEVVDESAEMPAPEFGEPTETPLSVGELDEEREKVPAPPPQDDLSHLDEMTVDELIEHALEKSLRKLRSGVIRTFELAYGDQWNHKVGAKQQEAWARLQQPPKKNTETGAFASPQVAINWGVEQGVFTNVHHARKSYDNLKAEHLEALKTGKAPMMAMLWIKKVHDKVQKALEEQEDDEAAG